MVLERKYREMAKALHQEFPAVDAHLDLAGELYFRKRERGGKSAPGSLSGTSAGQEASVWSSLRSI